MKTKSSRLNLYKKEVKRQYYLLILIPAVTLLANTFTDIHYDLAVFLGLLIVTPIGCIYNYYIATRYKLVMVHLSQKPYYKEERPFVFYSMLFLFLALALGLIGLILFGYLYLVE
ncbi:hypothetical protein [Kangiella sp.]|uniref:hypothetical protein n=1 Tax=Kangiella sp. TaxID=1920245 RepID=UPI003A9309B0